ncbi:MAG: hypothetical protein SGILL_005083 [Bacillariaceae sp.]
MTCNNITERKESFMDLNLPIAGRRCDKEDVVDVTENEDDDKGSKEKKAKKGTVNDAFGKHADSDVQFCLDRYMKPELLDGDNQYFCEKCNSKQDAERVTKLTQLPPVLNVQLSRYVFDRVQFVKRKLGDSVLLPTVLKVNSAEDLSGQKSYVLCGVMRHLGTSAHSGHYIAEAMDWSTGLWYEFNDETVKVLPDGPSCSYVPHFVKNDPIAGNRVSQGSKALFHGSQEAYESSVSGSLDAYNMYYVDEDYLSRKALETIAKRQKVSAVSSEDNAAKRGVLLDVITEKENKHSVLYDCEAGLDNKLRSNDPMVCAEAALCSHGCLLPSAAIKGKMLRKPVYESYVALLTGERELLRGTCPTSVVGKEMQASKNIICKMCSESRKGILSQKIELVQNMVELYDALRNDDNFSKKEDPSFYVVPKTWVTSFKRVFLEVMKPLMTFDEGGLLDSSNDGRKAINAGIDEVNLSRLLGIPSKSGSADTKQGKHCVENILDPKLTCRSVRNTLGSHGNRTAFRKNLIRFVPPEIWKLVKTIYPEAIEHKALDDNVEGISGRPYADFAGCPLCEQEKESAKQFRADIKRWTEETRANPALKKLLDTNRVDTRQIQSHNFNGAESGCRLVHRDDILNFRSAVTRIAKTTGDDIKASIEKIAFPPFHSVVYEFERESAGILLSSLKSLICGVHRKVIQSAIFQPAANEAEKSGQLSKCIAVLSDEEYAAYVSSLTDLLSILSDEIVAGRSSENRDPQAHTLLEDIEKHLMVYHPAIRMAADHSDDEESIRITLVSSDSGDSKIFVLSPPGICDCETCEKEFAPLLEMQKVEETNIESVSDSDGEGKPKSKKSLKDTGALGASANPIVLDSDTEDGGKTQQLRVFEFSGRAELSEAQSRLREAAGLSVAPALAPNELWGQAPRRSTRKRKAIFPIGCILKETTVKAGLHHNLAALRLFLYQSFEFRLQWKLFAALVSSDGDQPPTVLELSYSSNEESLQDILDKLKENAGVTECVPDDENELLLLYQENENDSNAIEASLMDALFEKSNAGGEKKEKGNRKRNRASERGFRGTLLQSSSSAVAASESEPKVSQKEDSPGGEGMNKASISDNDDDSVKSAPKSSIGDYSSDTELWLADRGEAIGKAMMEDCDESLDPSSLMTAIEWAIANSPRDSDATIRDSAYAKYFDIKENGRVTFDLSDDVGVELDNAKVTRMAEKLGKSDLHDCTSQFLLRKSAEKAIEKNPNESEEVQLDAALVELLSGITNTAAYAQLL